jgi:hypothetical protein
MLGREGGSSLLGSELGYQAKEPSKSNDNVNYSKMLSIR